MVRSVWTSPSMLPVAGILLEDRRAGEAEELGLREELLDGLVVVAELRAVAFVEDEDDALVRGAARAARGSLFSPLVALAIAARGPSFWMVHDDDLVGLVVRQQAADQRSVLVFSSTQPSWKRLNSSRVCRSRSLRSTTKRHFSMSGLSLSRVEALKRGERLAAASGVPDVAVADVLLDAVDDVLYGVDLVGPHHQQLLLASDEQPCSG